jgi:ATP-dependent Zn protease
MNIAIRKERIMDKKMAEIKATSKRSTDLLTVSRFMIWLPWLLLISTSIYDMQRANDSIKKGAG